MEIQKISFSPPLNLSAGGSSPPNMPPPVLNHSTSARVGRLRATHIKNISTTPMVKAKLR